MTIDEAREVLLLWEKLHPGTRPLTDALRTALAEVERLRAERDEAFAAMSSDGATACADNAILRAEVDRLRKDAERYRWLRSANTWLTGGVCDKRFMLREGRLDAAIDAAMERKDG